MPPERPLQPETQTTTRLLEGLHDPKNSTIWEEFDRRYRSILIAFARHMGLSEDDASDVAQETLARFIQEYRDGKYDRSRGRLRSWLIGIARYRILDHKRDQAGRREVRADSAIMDQAEEERLSAIWDAECRATILRRAVSELRRRTRMDPKTIRAFELIALERRDPQSVAAELDMKVDDVYIAKHRALEKLQKIVSEITDLYEMAPSGAG